MRKIYFKSKNELDKIVLAISNLMTSWDFKNDEWMIGKMASLYYLGIITDVKEVERDLTIYILRDKIPWLTNSAYRSRSTVAPAGSHYASEHHLLEQKFNCGIDLTPIPDVASTESWFTKSTYILVKNEKMNIESPKQYIDRRIVFCQQELVLPVQQVRDGYFVDKRRYNARMAEYNLFRDWALKNDHKIVLRVDMLIQLYDRLIKNIYPEIFDKIVLDDSKLIIGRAASGNKIVKGKVVIVDPSAKPPKDRVLVFSHFSPRDNHLASTAKAIITDGGGMLTHAMILCRELGVPCVVGTKVATKVLKDGDLVEVDAERGIVKKLR